MTAEKRDTRDRILDALSGVEKATAGQIGQRLGLDHRLVRLHLKKLVIHGLAFMVPSNRPVSYTVNVELTKAQPVVDPAKNFDADKLPVKQTVVPAGEWSLDHPVPAVRSAFDVGTL